MEQPTADCYAHAIELLQQRFGNQSVLIQDHMEGLIDIKQVPSSRNVRAFRRLYDGVQAHIRGLWALGVTDQSYSVMLYPILLRTLPDEMRLAFNRKMASGDNENSATGGTSAADIGSESSTKPRTLKEVCAMLNFLKFSIAHCEKPRKNIQGTTRRHQR